MQKRCDDCASYEVCKYAEEYKELYERLQDILSRETLHKDLFDIELRCFKCITKPVYNIPIPQIPTLPKPPYEITCAVSTKEV